MVKVGVLALQGDFAAHARAISRAGGEAVEVRNKQDLNAIDALVIPGGESTTMLKLLTEERLIEPVKELVRQGKPVLGTCAGAILLARDVHNPEQPSLNLIDIGVERNAYGRQVDSFIASVKTKIEGEPLEAVFIRAPKITRIGPGVEVLASHGKSPVLVRSGNVIVATFHPELTDDVRVHRLVVVQTEANVESAVPA